MRFELTTLAVILNTNIIHTEIEKKIITMICLLIKCLKTDNSHTEIENIESWDYFILIHQKAILFFSIGSKKKTQN